VTTLGSLPQWLKVPSAVAAEAPSTFREIFEQEYAYVRGSARRMGIREGDLEDLVHDVFLAVHRKLDQFDPARPLRPWLFGITYRVVTGKKRRFGYTRERVMDDEALEAVDACPGADEQMEAEERRRIVHEALGALDDDKRAVFILHDLEEVPVPEVARALEIPTNTAYSRLRLARGEFREALGRVLLRRGHGERSGAA
jgi:RNA polymerase sigma-70 factor (ECF subfamily)